jgi:hypothetical protein
MMLYKLLHCSCFSLFVKDGEAEVKLSSLHFDDSQKKVSRLLILSSLASSCIYRPSTDETTKMKKKKPSS